MSDIQSQPKSVSLLQPTKFQLTFKRAPYVTYFMQEFQIPGANLTTLKQSTPFLDRNVAGNKITYEDLHIKFIMDETLIGWKEIYDWMRSLGIRESFEDYKNLPKLSKVVSQSPHPEYSDAILNVLSTQNNPKMTFTFIDCFPFSLSPINFDTSSETDAVISCTASFKYFYYKAEIIQ